MLYDNILELCIFVWTIQRKLFLITYVFQRLIWCQICLIIWHWHQKFFIWNFEGQTIPQFIHIKIEFRLKSFCTKEDEFKVELFLYLCNNHNIIIIPFLEHFVLKINNILFFPGQINNYKCVGRKF